MFLLQSQTLIRCYYILWFKLDLARKWKDSWMQGVSLPNKVEQILKTSGGHGGEWRGRCLHQQTEVEADEEAGIENTS